MNKPIIFVDVDGVLTANKKLYYEVEKLVQQPSIVINPIYPPVPQKPFIYPEPNLPWTPMPGPTYPLNPPYPDPHQGIMISCNSDKPDLCCQDDDYNEISPEQAQEDWENKLPTLEMDESDPPKYTNTDSTNYLYLLPSKELCVAKQFSDKDSYIIQRAKALKSCDIVLISGDERVNRAWAEKQGVEFIYCPSDKEKYDFITKRGIWNYYYIGDAMPDYLCLTYAIKAFVPADASPLLINKLLRKFRLQNGNDNLIRVPRNGGDGVLDWVYTYLFARKLLLNEV